MLKVFHGNGFQENYLPIIKIIRERDVLKNFPKKTEGDLYLWVLDRQHYLAKQKEHPLLPPDAAAHDFIEHKDD